MAKPINVHDVSDPLFRIPMVEVGDIEALYATYEAATGNDKYVAKTKIFARHPFVKAAKTKEQRIGKLVFVIQGFQPDIWKFKKWLRKNATGRQFQDLTGSGFDDGLYTISPLLRQLLPRGYHYVRVYRGATLLTSLEFTGVKKFTGLIATDEDEKSKSSKVNFFYDGASISSCKSFFKTEKSNGENAKLRVIKVEETFFFLCGSKNTCLIWPCLEDSLKYHHKNNTIVAGPIACHEVSKWFLSLQSNAKMSFLSEAISYGSLLGEINISHHEHLFPIESTYIEFYTILHSSTGKSIHPKEAFEFFKKYTMPHVKYSHHDIKELEPTINEVRSAQKTEGSVLYVMDESEAVVGLVKVKATFYVAWRRIREVLRSKLFVMIEQGRLIGYKPVDPRKKISPYMKVYNKEDFIKAAKNKLSEALSKLTHLPNWKEQVKKWITLGQGFADWWMLRFEASGDYKKCLKEVSDNFASLYHEYLDSLENK